MRLLTRVARVERTRRTRHRLARQARAPIAAHAHPRFFQFAFAVTIDDRCLIECGYQIAQADLLAGITLNVLKRVNNDPLPMKNVAFD